MKTLAEPTAVARPPAYARAPYIAVATVALLIAATAIWGSFLDGIVLHAAPLFAAASSHMSPMLLVPVGIAGLVVWRGQRVAERPEWRRLLVIAFLATVAWGIGLALVDVGVPDGLVRGVSSSRDFLADVRRIDAPGPFLDTFVERIDEYVVHVRGHPPGLMVALWWMQKFGLGGIAPVVGVVIVAGGAAVVATLVAVRDIAGETTARRAAPFLVLSPAAIWLVASADALYTGLGAIGIAAVVVSTGHAGWRSDAAAAGGGLLLGAGLFASYGLAPLLLVPAVVAISRRRLRPLLIATAALVVVGTTFAGFGFSWLDGLWATRAEYVQSIASLRPYSYFVFANIAVFAITLGPAPIGGIAILRDRRLWLVVGAALVAVAAADLSGLSKGEVERIWLPFWPWVAVAAAALTNRLRWWLAGQATVAIGIQTFLGTPW